MPSQESSTLYWLFERAQLIQEFKRKGALPPPLNIVTLFLQDVPQAAQAVLRACGYASRESTQQVPHHRDQVRDGFAMVPGPAQQRRFWRRMQIARKKSLRREQSVKNASLEFQVRETAMKPR